MAVTDSSMRPVARSSSPLVGIHLVADLFGIRPAVLTEEQAIVDCLLDALRKADFNVLSYCSHKFPGEDSGVTALVLLSESHAAIHTYPEHEYAAIDVFSCGMPDPGVALAHLRDVLQPTEVSVHRQSRGRVGE
ncbi:MAG: adenosylmethionine decarboxylase [Planctomycetota bacterium]|nr:adenosylmethionine decarboxylase [Planctomycetota bacterium]